MLTAASLVVRYGAVQALHETSLTLDRGEIVGLIGLNGAGKSSVLHALCGEVSLRAGTVTIDGTEVPRTRMRPEAMVRRGVALVPESRRIFATLSVEENLRLGAVTRRGRDEVAAEIDRWCERFPDLGRFRGHRAGNLSGGQQQQLAIARSLMTRPSYLLLDEPSLGLAPGIVDALFELIGELRAAGTAILLVDQMVQRVLDVADRSYVLAKGRVLASGHGAELLPALEAAGLGVAVGEQVVA